MLRSTAVTLMLASPIAGPALAQSPGQPAAPAATAQAFVGTWVGTFQTEMGMGGAKLVVARAREWRATFEIEVNHPVEMGEVTDFKVEGSVVSWSQKLMANDCKAEGELAGNTIKGEMNCGAYVMAFSLQKS